MPLETDYDLYETLVDLDIAIAKAKETIEGLEYTLSEYPHCTATMRRIDQWRKALSDLCFNALVLLSHPRYPEAYDADAMPNLQHPSAIGDTRWTF